MKEYKNILIVRTDRIGDVILTTPSIKALKERYPQSRITVLVTPFTVDLIKGNPFLDEVLLDDRRGSNHGVKGFWRLVFDLRMRKFDLAIIYHTKKRTNALCFLSGIPSRVGYKNEKYGFLLNRPVNDERNVGDRHEAQYCLDLLGSLDIKGNALDMHVSLSEESKKWADDLLIRNNFSSGERLIAIHPGASDPSKCWPVKRFVELIDQLSQDKLNKFFVIGTNDITHLAREISKQTKNPVTDITGLTTLSQLASFLKRTTILISNDSGPVHIAAGVGTPVVSIFTRNQPGINPQRWQPLGEKSSYVAVPYDDQISFKKAGSAEPKYLETIETQAVLEAVDSIFKLC